MQSVAKLFCFFFRPPARYASASRGFGNAPTPNGLAVKTGGYPACSEETTAGNLMDAIYACNAALRSQTNCVRIDTLDSK